ncbi:MAG: PAS domain S-box protein, partial [Actinobacteria bacterium]|nr:PAS domain S-box protein [Actinomycetota bacterium]
GVIRFVNHRAEALFGYDRDALVGQLVEILVPQSFRTVHQAQRDGYVADPETRLMGTDLRLIGVRRDGTEFPVDISLSPVQTGEGLLVIAAVRDMTARNEAEEDRRRSDLVLAAMQFSWDAIIIATLDGIITNWNRSAETLFGYTSAEMIGNHIGLLSPEDGAHEITAILAKIRDGQHVEHLETARIRKDGTTLTVSMSVSPIHDLDGTVVGASAIDRDVTEALQAAQNARSLAAAHRLIHSMLTSASIGIALVGLDGYFTVVNSSMCDLLGYDEEWFRAHRLQDFVHPDDADEAARARVRLLADSRSTMVGQLRLVRADGETLWVRRVASLIHGEEGQPDLVMVQVEDITAEHEAHEAHEALAHQATIGDAVARLEAQSFVGRERELRQFARWLTSPEPLPAILNVSGPGGVGKSALLHAFRRAAADEGRRVRWVDGYSIAPEPEAFVAALGDADADADADAVLAEINETKPLVVLDTFERLGALAAYFTDEFLPALELGVKVVVSGRLPIGRAWSRNIPWHQVIQPMPLAALTPPDTTEFLARRGIAESTLVEQIMRATGGQPLALSMAVDLVEQFGVRDFAAAPEWRLRLRSLVERMLSDVSDPLLRTLLDACAVVRHFDEPMLAAVSGIDDISSAFDQLCRLSIVRPSDHGLVLHEDVRRILAEDLRWRQPDRYRRLELRCLEYYGQRVRTVGRAEREWLVAERLYLWGDDFAHMMLLAEDEPGDMWVVPGTDNDADELWPVVESWLRGGLGGEVEINFDDYPLEDAKAFTEALLSHPHRRVRVT